MVWALETMDEYRLAKMVLMAEVSDRGCEGNEVRLDGWCEGGLGQQRNDCGGCAKDRKECRALVHT